MMEFAFLPGIGPMEIAVIAVIALLVLGPSRLPEAARSLGKGMKEMRDSFSGTMDRDDDDDRDRPLDDDDDEDDLDEDADTYSPVDEIDLDEDEDEESTAKADSDSDSDEPSGSDAPTVKTA